jgi:hypothetical protein
MRMSDKLSSGAHSMTITLELLPDIEASLTAQAQAQGLQLSAYLQLLLEQQATAKSPEATMSLEQLEAKLDALAEGSESLAYLPPEATTREGLYRDHD